MKTNFIRFLFVAVVSAISLQGFGQVDSTCVVNGFVYEVEEDRPLEGVGLRWYQFDTLGVVLDVDSILTDADGKFSVILTKGLYSFYIQLEYYRGCVSYRNLELTDSSYTLDFAVYYPVISVSHDSLLIPVDPENSVQREIIIQNAGSGKLSFNSILYLRDEVPENLDQINDGGICDIIPDVYYGPPEASAWKCLVQDSRDQESGMHDIKSVSTQMIEGTFYLKFDLYDTIGSYEDLDIELWFNTDPADSTGHPDTGFEYLVYISSEPGYLVAPLLDYANGNYHTLSAPVYADIWEENSYLTVGYPRSCLCQYDVILATAFSRGGSGESFYTDYAPDRDLGDILFTVKSHPFIELLTLYGVANEAAADTITLTIDPGIQNDTLDHFYLGIMSEDEVTPITIIPVQLQKALPADYRDIGSIAATEFIVYPNPGESDITLRYNLNKTAKVTLLISDLQGRTITTLFNGIQEQGEYTHHWNSTTDSGDRPNTGLYCCQLIVDDMIIRRRLILLR